MNAGAVIKEKREQAGLTQKTLARRVGVYESTVWMYELGLKTTPHDVANVTTVALADPSPSREDVLVTCD